MTIVTRFAPSPTGLLHVGNSRTAIIAWLFAQKMHGKFILRMDDTDIARSSDEYKAAIVADLTWLGLKWDDYVQQSTRLSRYETIKNQLIEAGRLYECYETAIELETKRKIQLSSGQPPIYDRAAWRLNAEQKQKYKEQGRTPHYRFLLEDSKIIWQDMIKGEIEFAATNLSDPILIREDGSMTYMLCSAVDDVDMNVTHIIRGEDHVSNTAIQIQIFQALTTKLPIFGHVALVQSKDSKISKRSGGFDIKTLREEAIEPLTLLSFLSTIGTSKPTIAMHNIEEVIDNFAIEHISNSPTNYAYEDLERINHKIVSHYEFTDIQPRLTKLGLDNLTKEFWYATRDNINKFDEILLWWQICQAPKNLIRQDDQFLKIAANLLPEGDLDSDSWTKWTKLININTGRQGRELFMPLRFALTGMDHGPELQKMLPLIGRTEIIARLNGTTNLNKHID